MVVKRRIFFCTRAQTFWKSRCHLVFGGSFQSNRSAHHDIGINFIHQLEENVTIQSFTPSSYVYAELSLWLTYLRKWFQVQNNNFKSIKVHWLLCVCQHQNIVFLQREWWVWPIWFKQILWQLLELISGQFPEEIIAEDIWKAKCTYNANHYVIIGEVSKDLLKTKETQQRRNKLTTSYWTKA